MSIEKNYYVIVGYDLTGYAIDKFEDWRWTPEGEKFFNNQSKGNIQLFDDPMSGNYLYLGYILAEGDQYHFPTTYLNILKPSLRAPYVQYLLIDLIDSGVIDKKILDANPSHELIIFEECI